MSKGSIVVVHEELQSLAQAMSSLTQKGFEVVGAKDGADAIRKLETGFSDVVIITQNGGRAALVLFKPKGASPIALLCPLAPTVQPMELRPDSLKQTLEKLSTLKDSALARDAGIIKEVTDCFSQQQDLPKLIGEILPKLGQVLRAENVYLIRGERPDKLAIEYSWGGGTVDAAVVLKLADVAVRQAAPVVALTGVSPVAEVAAEISKAKISSLVVLPLMTRKRMVGLLAAINTGQGKTLSQSDFHLVDLFGLELSLILDGDRMNSQVDELGRNTGELKTQVEQRQREISALNNFIQTLNNQKQAFQQDFETYQARHSTLIKVFLSLLEKDEVRLQGHTEQVVKWTLAVGEALGINLEDLSEAAYFHHIGGLSRARSFISAPLGQAGGVSPADDYPLVGEKVAEIMQLPMPIRQAVRHQRENFDGSGYPDKLSGDNIPLASRLLRVTCTYVDLVSELPGRQPFKPGEVLAHFREGAAKFYDPRVVEAFLKLVKTEKEGTDTGVLSTISHELRSPLTYLMGYSELLSGSKDLPQEARQAAQEISTEATHMARILESLSDISRFETGKAQLFLQDVDLSRLVGRSVAKARERSKQHQLEMDIPPELPLLKADPDKVTQVLDNLLNNAINYSPNGTRIGVKVTPGTGELVTGISDQGIGIPRDKISSLFQKYYRVDSPLKDKVKGMGIGLNLCKHIVEAHGGRIWVESEEGRGSTFYFSLPLSGK